MAKRPVSDDPICKLPLHHPDFRYGGSRNPYSGKISSEMDGRVYSDHGSEAHRGGWRSKFPDAAVASLPKPESLGWRGSWAPEAPVGESPDRDGPPVKRRPLHVEIGCNAGHVVVEWAKRDPGAAYVGLDWKFKQVYRAAEKAKKKGIDNLLFFRAHADRLPFMFGEGEIDHLYLYFPDPWPKKSQLKNRWLNAKNLERIHPLLPAGGTFHIKTDHRGYYDWMLEAISQVPSLWKVHACSADLHAGNPDAKKLVIPEVTLFERLFIQDGLPIHSIWLTRV